MSTTNPRITTQWGDIHRKLGNFAPLEEVVTEEEMTNTVVDAIESINPLESLSIKQLERMEEAKDSRSSNEDELSIYRRKRLQELKLKQKYNRFGDVVHVGKADFIEVVTRASAVTVGGEESDANVAGEGVDGAGGSMGTWVLVHVYAESQPFCLLFNEIWTKLAKKFRHVKFVRGYVHDVIPKYPEEKLPVVLIYKNGECVKQLFGVEVWQGSKVTCDYVEYVFGKLYKVWETDIDENPLEGGGRRGTTKAEEWWTKNRRGDDSGSDEEEEERRVASDRSYSRLSLDSLQRFNR